MIRIRRMVESDITRVAQIEKMIFADPWSEKVYRETLELPEAGYVVAVEATDDKEEIVGAAGVRNIVGTGEITNVMILPGYRGRGIARQMLTDLLEVGRELGASDFTLEVRAGNEPAIKLYEGLGFESEGIRPGFYRNPTEDAVIYWLRQ
ncbi:MAG: ribosomal protein S18-alanine N-acetyltransferase [Lachnospiraceae bacterium]|nr:ribosomal protein S18-alanine N-acetyltransferase [Lachnospiraceae bacterium]